MLFHIEHDFAKSMNESFCGRKVKESIVEFIQKFISCCTAFSEHCSMLLHMGQREESEAEAGGEAGGEAGERG